MKPIKKNILCQVPNVPPQMCVCQVANECTTTKDQAALACNIPKRTYTVATLILCPVLVNGIYKYNEIFHWFFC